MPIVISPSSELGKELRKWEQSPTPLAIDEEGDMRPGNPYQFRPFPVMLYKAFPRPNGQVRCMEAMPSPYLYTSPDQYERAVLEVESFNKSCQRIVTDERERSTAYAQGWCDTPDLALAKAEALAQDVANAAAEAAYGASRMRETARREFDAAQAETHEHVVDVQPRRRGRQPKAITGAGPVEG